ncbi:Cytidine/deoxycytidylate deaminase family protein [Pyrenophora tritici-repentis]|uniref:Cytidine/deoxycytidylate deaminase family protein n=2 Tax=Pyrenophora tritici-repentis TaxID=45151 RepID=A0A2W1DE97_9PLEO|nr:cytidine/deoxycytidylate deaminase family protein [Pyrenophora tritici-repentis Pt-1C-BFP]KAG9381114.1 Cytidine/deoxycytidylate deaminase family protein [Pyrenophora tritici-repentis]EDU43807.1 cytidine/deoxycytidylate deaminase family protein [Pyrenophora tritici-repentis Pt-1C-BFP]KAI0572240.1 Cytidine/deoxycytidylate deaminase family protein [Pyrenophora tritici-repentis]KAI0579355.1 Cytidine/deoxycytidylate deaminase family protein [Pyrenophora tritici-repentis]KAI0620499.1 Cytidine/deo
MSTPPHPEQLVTKLLSTIESHIIPLTKQGVSTGSKLFGAAILSRTDLTPYTLATNNERLSPLLHGEINCIQKFFTVDYPNPSTRPHPAKDCIFLATHEPCSLCLSGITWAGFNEFYYLFTYEDSRDLFGIPYDIDILQEVFRVKGEGESENGVQKRQLYNRKNKFFTAKSFKDLVGKIGDEGVRTGLEGEIKRVKALYNGLSETYQEGKKAGAESSSVWK